MARKKKIIKQTDTNKTSDASVASEVSQFDPNFSERLQRYLFTTGVILFLGFWVLVLLPIIREDIYVERETIFSDLLNIVGVLLIANLISFTLVNFLNINIRSKTELEEERVRKQESERLREIDLRLEILRFSVTRGMEDAYDIQDEYDELKLERDLITNKELDKLELYIFSDWGRILIDSRIRLKTEEERLKARNVANLAYGVLAAVLGVVILITVAIIPYIWTSFATPAFNGIPVYYFPVTPVVIISEIVAIFFLRLHAQTEHRLERNKNEITNIELRLASGLLNSKADKPDFDSLADTLSKEERNFVLKKNESSSEFDIDKAVEIATKIIKATK